MFPLGCCCFCCCCPCRAAITLDLGCHDGAELLLAGGNVVDLFFARSGVGEFRSCWWVAAAVVAAASTGLPPPPVADLSRSHMVVVYKR